MMKLRLFKNFPHDQELDQEECKCLLRAVLNVQIVDKLLQKLLFLKMECSEY